MRMLVLSNNAIEGKIPESIGKLKVLEGLELGNNKIEGSLPEGLGKLVNLNRLVLHENQLSGSVPSAVLALPKLRVLQLQNNQFGVDTELKEAMKRSNYALFDMGLKTLRFENNDTHGFDFEKKTRMVDTKFEDMD